MIEKYLGDEGKRLRLDALSSQRAVMNTPGLAEALEPHVTPQAVAKGDVLIQQGADDDDVYFIFSGSFKAEVNGRQVSTRGRDDAVGEMTALEPGQKRSATVTALEHSVVGKISEGKFNEVGEKFGQLYRLIAKQLARRLLERNKHVGLHRERIKVFIISSVGALEIAYGVQAGFQYDDIEVEVWTNDVFKAGKYTLEALESAVNEADFAIAIAHYDDTIVKDDKQYEKVRDNVIFELGLFMGRLGRNRAILLEPRDEQLKLPTDLQGVTTFTYSMKKSDKLATVLSPACHGMRQYFKTEGPFNG